MKIVPPVSQVKDNIVLQRWTAKRHSLIIRAIWGITECKMSILVYKG